MNDKGKWVEENACTDTVLNAMDKMRRPFRLRSGCVKKYVQCLFISEWYCSLVWLKKAACISGHVHLQRHGMAVQRVSAVFSACGIGSQKWFTFIRWIQYGVWKVLSLQTFNNKSDHIQFLRRGATCIEISHEQ